MKTLDQILMEKTIDTFKSRIDSVTDVASWTPQNRDAKLEEAFALSKETATVSRDFIAELLDEKGEDQTLPLSIQREFLGGVYTFFENWRSNLDATPDEDLPNQPVTYEWLNAQIRSLYKTIMELDTKIERNSRSLDSTTVTEV